MLCNLILISKFVIVFLGIPLVLYTVVEAWNNRIKSEVIIFFQLLINSCIKRWYQYNHTFNVVLPKNSIAFLIISVENININIFILGLMSAIWYYLIFSPKILNNILFFKEEILEKKDSLKLLIIFLIPHFSLFFFLYFIKEIHKNIAIYMFFFILIQTIIVIPTFYGFAQLGKWKPVIYSETSLDTKIKNTWGSPLLFLNLSIGVLYPLIFIGYFLLLRYLFLGRIVDMSFLFYLNSEIIPVILFFLCYIPVFFLLIIQYSKLRTFLWYYWINSLNVLNLVFVQNLLYFNLIRQMHKFVILIFDFTYYYNPSQTQKLNTILILSKIFQIYLYYSWVMFLLIFFIPCFEIIFTKQLFYSQYYIFYFFLIKSIWFLINNFNYHWTLDVCMSNYLYKNYLIPHYQILY